MHETSGGNTMSHRRVRFPVFVSLVVAVVVCTPLLAGPRPKNGDASKQSAEATEKAPPAASHDATAESRAAAPARGVPLRFEDTDLARMINHDATRLTVRKAADGTMMLDLAGGFRSVLVMTIDADGKQVVSCISSEKQARKMFEPAQPNAPKEH
jgi:hypothetical protein